MGKKRKNKKKRDYLTEWDGKFYGFHYNETQAHTFAIHTANSQDIHEVAQKIFGQTYYIDFSQTD